MPGAAAPGFVPRVLGAGQAKEIWVCPTILFRSFVPFRFGVGQADSAEQFTSRVMTVGPLFSAPYYRCNTCSNVCLLYVSTQEAGLGLRQLWRQEHWTDCEQLRSIRLQAKRHQPWEEADDDAVFAAALLGELHDTVRVVGDVFRIVGDTAGALTGGSIKAVGAAVNVRRLGLLLMNGVPHAVLLFCSCGLTRTWTYASSGTDPTRRHTFVFRDAIHDSNGEHQPGIAG